MQVTAEKQAALRLNEALLQEHEELQAFVAQETSRHHNAEVHGLHHSNTHVQSTAFGMYFFSSVWLDVEKKPSPHTLLAWQDGNAYLGMASAE